MASLRSNLGYVLYKKEEYSKAERHFGKAVQIYQKHYGVAHPDVARWKFWVGKTCIHGGQVLKGRDNLRDAMKISADCTAALGRSVFTSEQFEEMHLLVMESEPNEDVSMSDSAGEPAAEPPS